MGSPVSSRNSHVRIKAETAEWQNEGGGYAGPKRVQILAGEEAQDWARELNGNYV